ncbi:MAG: hypothetical protein Q9164_004994 [Protoblastenia rupestris]
MQASRPPVEEKFGGHFDSYGGPQFLANHFNTAGGSIYIDSTSSPTEENDCLRSLWPAGIDYESQKNQNPKRVPGTCQWTLNNPKYIEWRNNDSKKLLLISADPGCGKSVLARCIIDEDLRQAFLNDPSKRVLYYFFKDTSPEQRSATRAISSILHQLLASQRQLIRYALPSYREIGTALSTTFPKLWSIFTEAAVDQSAGDIVCVFDALDECDEHEQPVFIKALEDFYLHRPSTSRVKFLLTSRPYFAIRREFDEILNASENIELVGNDESASIKEEIDIVIRHRVASIAKENRLAREVRDHLEKRLLETEHRTYLWLRLLWEIIRKNLSGTITRMNELIDKLPASIQDAYEILLQRCPDPLFARKVLQIVLVAGRPLTLDEMDFALNINERTLSYADLELEGMARLQETLSSRCGLMISIVQSKVYFIHQTVKEFLLNTAGNRPRVGRTWQQSLNLEGSHNDLAKICLQSITFSEIQMDRANLCNAFLPEHDREMEPEKYCHSYTFLPYTAIYWAEHCRNVNSDKAIKTIEDFLESNGHRSVVGRWGIDFGTTLHAASAGGHKKIVEILLEKGADINAQGGYYGNALQAASFRGHEQIPDIDAQGRYHGNALQAASLGGHEQIVQLLLQKGADINAQSGNYSNALQAASYKGHEQIVQLLLQKGADINAQGGRYGNALQAASSRGHEQIVQLLLQKGADINAQGGDFGNALQAASSGYNEQIVQLLLQKGADINAQGGYYDNALQAASFRGHEQIVQLLLQKGADINAQGRYYGNVLQAASSRGHEQIVQLLLQKGADINAQGGYYGNALQAASFRGDEQIVQLLLQKGADINAQGGDFGNALQAASFRGYEQIVQLLLQKGADINAQGEYYSNVL